MSEEFTFPILISCYFGFLNIIAQGLHFVLLAYMNSLPEVQNCISNILWKDFFRCHQAYAYYALITVSLFVFGVIDYSDIVRLVLSSIGRLIEFYGIQILVFIYFLRLRHAIVGSTESDYNFLPDESDQGAITKLRVFAAFVSIFVVTCLFLSSVFPPVYFEMQPEFTETPNN